MELVEPFWLPAHFPRPPMPACVKVRHTPLPKMEGEEGANDWESLDPGDVPWEQQEGWEAPSIDSPFSQQAPVTSGSSGLGLAADYQRWRDDAKETDVMHVR